MTDELHEAYLEMFGEGFPTFQVCRGRTEKECAELIQKCLDTGKDAYELGYCSLDEDIQY